MPEQLLYRRWLLCVVAAVVALLVVAPGASWAGYSTVTLTFEGLQNGESIDNFFNGGTGGWGSTPDNSVWDHNLGIQFVGGAFGYIPEGEEGGSALIATGPDGFANGDANGSVGVAYLTSGVVMNVMPGFVMPLSFWYASLFDVTNVRIYDQLGGSASGATPIATFALDPYYLTQEQIDEEEGGLLRRWDFAVLEWPENPVNGFSVEFDGPAFLIVFDQVTVNLVDNITSSSSTVPESATVITWSVFGVLGGLIYVKRSRRASKLSS